MARQTGFSLILMGFFFAATAIAEPFTAEHLVRLDRVGATGVVFPADSCISQMKITGCKSHITHCSGIMKLTSGCTIIWTNKS